jgi:hypothetical protein
MHFKTVLIACAAARCTSNPSATTVLGSMIHSSHNDEGILSPPPPRRPYDKDVSDNARRTQDNPSSPQSPPATIQKYTLWEPSLISKTLQEWAVHYPGLVRVTTSQAAYGLPRAGTSEDCPFDDGGDGCLNYIVTIQDFTRHPEGSDSSNRLPEVL